MAGALLPISSHNSGVKISCLRHLYNTGVLGCFYLAHVHGVIIHAVVIIHLVKDIEVLEKSQKFALRVCTWNWSATNPELLSSTQISTLSDRRQIAKLCLAPLQTSL